MPTEPSELVAQYQSLDAQGRTNFALDHCSALVAHLKDALAEVEASKAKADLWQRSCEGWPTPTAMYGDIQDLRAELKRAVRYHEDACLARDRFEADRERLRAALDRVRQVCELYDGVAAGYAKSTTSGGLARGDTLREAIARFRTALDGPQGDHS